MHVEDYETIAALLSSGFDLQTVLGMVVNPRNMQRMAKLHTALEQGLPLQEHFVDIPAVQKHFAFLCQHQPLHTALQRAIQLYHFENSLKKRFLQMIAYPMLVVCVSWIGLQANAFLILPMLDTMLSQLEIDALGNWTCVIQCVAIVSLICMLTAAIGIIVFYILYRYNQLLKYCLRYAALRRIRILSFSVSFIWTGYWLELSDTQTATSDAIACFLQLRHRPFLYHCAQQVEDELLHGSSFADAVQACIFFSERLKQHYQMGIYTNQLQDALRRYQIVANHQLERFIKRFVILLQSITYGSVACIVILMTQVLFAPLQMLEQL